MASPVWIIPKDFKESLDHSLSDFLAHLKKGDVLVLQDPEFGAESSSAQFLDGLEAHGIRGLLSSGFSRGFHACAKKRGLPMFVTSSETLSKVKAGSQVVLVPTEALDASLPEDTQASPSLDDHVRCPCIAVNDPVERPNAAGRLIPEFIPGYGVPRRYGGVNANRPVADQGAPVMPRDNWSKDKACATLQDALVKCGLKDGMTLSFHHHLRDGDAVVGLAVDAIQKLGVKNLTLAPSALFPVHAVLLPLLKDGTVHKIVGSMNGPIGKHVSEGGMQGVGVLRSHGGRARAVAHGDIAIDIAVMAAPAADPMGNASGLVGKNACGPLGFAHADQRFAGKVIVVTDTLMPYPLFPNAIQEIHVDHVVTVDSIGDNSKIVSGSVRFPDAKPVLHLASTAAQVVKYSGYLKDGVNLQAGAGGASLASMKYIGDVMEEEGYVAATVMGGTTTYAVDMLHKGLTRSLLTGQAFDTVAVESMTKDHTRHHEISVDFAYNPMFAGTYVEHQDVVITGGTEVDVNFNVNVNTHSDGYLLHGIGGHQDAAISRMTIVTVPSYRKTNPIIVDDVTTITTPGAVVDVVICELGVAVNPLRPDLLDALKKAPSSSGIHLMTIEEMRDQAAALAGRSYARPPTLDNVVAVIEWRDGTVLDVVKQVDVEAARAAKEKAIAQAQAQAAEAQVW